MILQIVKELEAKQTLILYGFSMRGGGGGTGADNSSGVKFQHHRKLLSL